MGLGIGTNEGGYNETTIVARFVEGNKEMGYKFGY